MRALRTLVVILFVSITIIEIAARLIPAIPAMVSRLEPERAWEDRFLEMMKNDRHIVFGAFHRPHPTRGWTLAPNAHETVDGFTYTTNERAFRSLTPYRADPSKLTVLAIGDSFTFGIDTNDDATWPYLLQARDQRLNVINLGVGGYGIDQMDVTLREEIATYHPRLVVAAYIGDDLRRALLSFRDYKKPRFVLRGGQLRLTNVPVGTPDQVMRELETRRRWFDQLYTYRILAGITRSVMGLGAPEDNRPLRPRDIALDTKLFDDMDDICHEHGAEFLVVYFSYGEGLFDAKRPEEGETFLRSYGAHHPVVTLDMRPIFLGQHRTDWVKGHYQLRENTVVSRAIDDTIRALIPGTPADVRSRAPAKHSHP